MNYNSMSKTALIADLTAKEAQIANLTQTAQNAVNLANYFAFNLETIEKLILDSPVGKGKFFKTFFFIISNWKAIRDLIESIVNQIREWRDKVEELKEAQKKEQENLTSDNVTPQD